MTDTYVKLTKDDGTYYGRIAFVISDEATAYVYVACTNGKILYDIECNNMTVITDYKEIQKVRKALGEIEPPGRTPYYPAQP